MGPTDKSEAPRPAIRAGEELRVEFSCPDCGAPGWVFWKQLPRGMRCHACGGPFWIGAGGRLSSQRTCAKVRFVCPRCKHETWTPLELVAKGTHCPCCELLCYLGHDRAFHAESAPEATHRDLVASDSARRRNARPRLSFGRPACLLAAGFTSLVVIAIGLSTARWGPAGQPSLETIASDFTNDCLQGRSQAALARVQASHERDFRHWVALRYGRSVTSLAKDKPVTLDIDRLQPSPDHAKLQLTISIGGRTKLLQTQYWTRANETWFFDARTAMDAVRRME